MTRLQSVKAEALTLCTADRAHLVAELLDTLPAVLIDDDEGLAEAAKRDDELDQGVVSGIDLAALKKGLGR